MKYIQITLLSIMIVFAMSWIGGCTQSDKQPIATLDINGEATNSSLPTMTPKVWSKPPEMQIDTKRNYVAAVSTSLGDFMIELYSKEAPLTVNNFVFLAKQGYYDGVTFHRIVESFMIQTGDPTGTGSGGPGYKFEDEVNRGYTYDIGTVAMANSGADTNGSQFFICSGLNCAGLPQNYSIFGKVTEGLEVIDQIQRVPVQVSTSSREKSSPIDPVIINSVSISEKE
jgi:cyclophilin family peptidyl-prolyl cis-trans isomerase